MIIRDAKPEDAGLIAGIYNYYVVNTFITFEEEPVSEAGMRDRITTVQAQFPWLVADEGHVLGYAYASKFRERASYRFSVETTVYCERSHQHRGTGEKLYGELVRKLRSQGLKVAYGVIALPNDPSVRLHEKLGFKKVAHLSSVGFKMDRWIDVGYWELQLG